MNISYKLRLSTRLSTFFKRTFADLSSKDHRKLPEDKARQTAVRVLLIGTTVITGIFFILLLLSCFVAGNTYIMDRVVTGFIAFVYMLCACLLLRYRKYSLVAMMLVGFYMSISALLVWVWSINLPYATLLMCITISLTAILLGATATLVVGGILSLVILVVQFFTTSRLHVPDASWQNGRPSEYGEAIAYCLLFLVLALITWLFGRQLERSLYQARRAEAALTKEKQMLSTRLEERTEKLRAAQMQEMQQLYRFAGLGQLSTALLHDLANHLTTLTLDIEDLKVRRRTESIERARQSISYLEDLVARVSRQLHDKGEITTFDAHASLQTVLANLHPKIVKAGIKLTVHHHGEKHLLKFEGDSTRFSQVMTILVTNAIDALQSQLKHKGDRRLQVDVYAQADSIQIKVSDWGKGITDAHANGLFQPFYTTKEDGMGLGLFISKQIIETHFKGTITLESAHNPTIFIVALPRRSVHA